MTHRLKRVGLLAAMSVVSVNVWTGSPLLALWIGSRVVSDSGQTTMLAILVVAAVLLAFSLVLIKALGMLQVSYDEAAGRKRAIRRHTPWLRSMRGERPHEVPEGVQPTPLERILVVMVVIAVAAFEIWFFFFSGSPIDQRSGRD
jgi:hypothetical protein